MEPSVGNHSKQQVRAARISIFASVFTFLIAAVVGIAVDSITLLLDASAGLVILATAVLTHSSLKKIRLPPDDLYHFGYGKYEPFTVSIQGTLIIITCLISLKFAIQDIVHPEDIHSYTLPVAAALAMAVMGLMVSRFLKRTGRRTDSAMLKTAGLHWQADTVLSFGMCAGFLVGLAGNRMGYTEITPYVDPVMAVALALYLLLTPLKAIAGNSRELLDAAPEGDIREKVSGVVEDYRPKSFGVHRLRVRKAGERIFIDVCFVLPADLTVDEASGLAANFERDLKTRLPQSDVVVYFKPGPGRA